MAPVRRLKSKGGGGVSDLSPTRMALLAVPLMIGVTIVVMFNNMHLQHAHIHKKETVRSVLASASQDVAVARGGGGLAAVSTPEQAYEMLVQLPQGQFAELMQRVYAKRTLGLSSMSASASAWAPDRSRLASAAKLSDADMATGGEQPKLGEVAVASRHPRGLDNKLLVLGVCTNIHNV